MQDQRLPVSFRAFLDADFLMGLIFAILGVLLVIKSSGPGSLSFSGLLVILGALAVTNALMRRLSFTETQFIKKSIFASRMDYDDIASITWGYAPGANALGGGGSRQRVARYILTSKSGKRIMFAPYAYHDKQQWAALLLTIAQTHNVSLDAKVSEQLQTAVTSSEVKKRMF